MKDLLKLGVLFLLGSVIFSLLGSTFTILFTNMNSVITYVSTGSVGMLITEVVSLVGWLLDILFIQESFIQYSLITVPSITIPSINWLITIFRVMFYTTLFVIILSLIFGRGGNE